jgi:hypothetical protein
MRRTRRRASSPRVISAFSAHRLSADDELVVEGEPAEALVFEAAATPVRRMQEEPKGMTEAEIQAEKDRLAEERREFEANKTTFEAGRKAARTSANKTRVASLVTAGRVLPADAPALEKVFDALAEGVDQRQAHLASVRKADVRGQRRRQERRRHNHREGARAHER